MQINKTQLEYLRFQAKQRFDQVRESWLECGRWAAPQEVQWMQSKVEGARNNQHIVDGTHVLALRSFEAGFLEGNTSASRPWYRIVAGDRDINQNEEARAWLQNYNDRTFDVLAASNFYHGASIFYRQFGVFNTGAHYIDEIHGSLFFHNLVPGSYFVMNNGYGEAVILVLERTLTIKAVVDTYGVKKNGQWDWSNFSSRVRKMYEQGNYNQTVDLCCIVQENSDFDPKKPQAMLNKKWLSVTYEVGANSGEYYADGSDLGAGVDVADKNRYLKIAASRRKPFIVGKSATSGNFEYGVQGPTLNALGVIKSLNKKAIAKDQALEQILKPTMQGPASLRKSYITTQSNSFIPLDATSMSQKGIQPVFQVNPVIAPLLQDVTDLRQMVERYYYADYLLYLSQNPKTRTATETNAVVQEQQLVIGPMLQSLNYTYNMPVVEFVMNYVLDEDPNLPPPPKILEGQFLQTKFISVFAQAQRAADLPSIDRYVQAMIAAANQDPNAKILDKVNLDKYADLYEDRLYLPSGLNNPQGKVDAMRQQAAAMAQRQQMMHQTIPAMAGAVKDVSGLKVAQ